MLEGLRSLEGVDDVLGALLGDFVVGERETLELGERNRLEDVDGALVGELVVGQNELLEWVALDVLVQVVRVHVREVSVREVQQHARGLQEAGCQIEFSTWLRLFLQSVQQSALAPQTIQIPFWFLRAVVFRRRNCCRLAGIVHRAHWLIEADVRDGELVARVVAYCKLFLELHVVFQKIGVRCILEVRQEGGCGSCLVNEVFCFRASLKNLSVGKLLLLNGRIKFDVDLIVFRLDEL